VIPSSSARYSSSLFPDKYWSGYESKPQLVDPVPESLVSEEVESVFSDVDVESLLFSDDESEELSDDEESDRAGPRVLSLISKLVKSCPNVGSAIGAIVSASPSTTHVNSEFPSPLSVTETVTSSLETPSPRISAIAVSNSSERPLIVSESQAPVIE